MRAFWAENCYRRNVELCFVKKIEKHSDTRLKIIAKDLYNVYINGVFAHYGPARAAKGYARVDELLLDSYLTKEENEICVYVQSNYAASLCFALEKPLFGAELYVGGALVADGGDFVCYEMTDKLCKTERMSSQRGFLEIYRMEQDRERGDKATRFSCVKMVEVDSPKLLPRNVGFASNAEAQATLYETGGVIVDTTRVWKNDFTDLLDGTGKGNMEGYVRSECDDVLSLQLTSFVFTADTATRLQYKAYAFDRVQCGKFKLALCAKTNATVYVTYDDYLIDGKVKFNREQITHGLKWTLAKGEYVLHSNEVYTGKYVTLIIDGEVEVQSVAMLRIENNEVGNFSFTCADKDLQDIVAASVHSFQHNTYDLPTDCPTRERAGYLCDGYFASQAETFFTGGNKVEENFFENYALYKNEHFKSDGILPMCYPSEPSDDQAYIPNWVLWYIVQLYDRGVRVGDMALSVAEQEKIKAVLAYFESKENEFGLLEGLEGWLFLEWSKASDYMEDVNFPSNMLYLGALKGAGELLGDKRLLCKAESLKQTILRMSYNGEYFVDNAVRKDGKLIVQNNISETCQYFAAFFDVITRAENPDFYQRIITRFGAFRVENAYPEIAPSNMFMGYVLRLALLDKEGECDLTLKECAKTFRAMAAATSTIWELFADNASCNHGFGAVVGMYISKALVGLKSIDEKNKIFYFHKKSAEIDGELAFPVQGGVAKISVKGGKRSALLPDGYKEIIL